MNYLKQRIRSHRLPRGLLMICAVILLALTAMTVTVAVISEYLTEDQTIELRGNLTNIALSKARGADMYTYTIDNRRSEFVSLALGSFTPRTDREFNQLYGEVWFRLRKSDSSAIEKRQRVEIVGLRTEAQTYFSIDDWNREVIGGRKVVSFVLSGVLALAGAILLWLAALSPKSGEQVEEWRRFRVS